MVVFVHLFIFSSRNLTHWCCCTTQLHKSWHKRKGFSVSFKWRFPPDASTARQSQTTGHLVVIMPKLSAKLCFQWKTSKKNFSKNLNLGNAVDKTEKNSTKTDVKQTSQKLEVFDKKKNDIFNIVGNEHTEKKLTKEKDYQINKIGRLAEIEFLDDPAVPPLMWSYSTG